MYHAPTLAQTLKEHLGIWIQSRRLSKKSDVYAFGVVLFEVLSGRKAVDLTLEEQQHSLSLWAQQCIRKGTIDHLIDSSMKEQISPHCLRRFAEMASKCLHDQPKERPTMSEIVVRLDLIALELQGGADSYTEEEVIDVGGVSNKHVDSSITTEVSASVSHHYGMLLMEVINESMVLESILPGRTKSMELLKKEKYGFDQGPWLGRRLWGSLFQRMRSSTSKTEACPLLRCCFSLAEIQAFTNYFNDELLIGKSDHSKVYAGYIRKGKKKVAIKQFNRDYCYEWFCSELEVQSQLQCMNVVSLVGYCNEEHEMIMVHEYMANGNLFDRLHNTSYNNNPLSWKQGLQTCIGVAQGLNYLHTGVKGKTIIHGDVKPHNILLDQNCIAKISDFNLSLLVPEDCDVITTMLRHELAYQCSYLDPEYLHTSRFTEKSDVYSLGVMLLELLSAKQSISMQSRWAIECIEAGLGQEIIDPYLIGKISPLCLSECVKIARKCVLKSGTKRPLMTDVVRKLELALDLQVANDAASRNEVIKMVGPHYYNQIEDVVKEQTQATDYSSPELLSSEWRPSYIDHSSSFLENIELSGPW